MSDPEREVHLWSVTERTRPSALGRLLGCDPRRVAEADPKTYEVIADNFAHWDDIDCVMKADVFVQVVMDLPVCRVRDCFKYCRLGAEVELTAFNTAVDDLNQFEDSDIIVAADGLNSAIRTKHREHFRPEIDLRPNRFTWLGTTRQFPAFALFQRK